MGGALPAMEYMDHAGAVLPAVSDGRVRDFHSRSMGYGDFYLVVLERPHYFVLYFGYKWWMKSKIIPLEEVPVRPFIEHYQKNPEPEPKPKRGLRRLNILWE